MLEAAARVCYDAPRLICAMPMQCPNCGTELTEAARFCSSCGQPVSAATGAGAMAAPEPDSQEEKPVVFVDPATLAPREATASPFPRAEEVPAPSQPQLAPAGEVRYAGFWRRAAAYVIDSLLLFLVSVVLAVTGLAVHLQSAGETLRPDPEFLQSQIEAIAVPLEIVNSVIVWLYFALLESSRWQATLGKQVIGLVVTDLAGRRISFWRATGRHLGKFIALQFLASFLPLSHYASAPFHYALIAVLTLFGLASFVLAGLTRRKQALHDLMADCLVIRRR